MNPAGEGCGSCMFCASVVAHGMQQAALFCRRNPPVPVVFHVPIRPSPSHPDGGISTQVIGYQAPVTPETWCSEYRGKPAGKPS